VGYLRVSSPLCTKMYELICSQIWLMANADHSCTTFASPPPNGPVRHTYRYKYHSPTGGSPYRHAQALLWYSVCPLEMIKY
jgi:hypothetical protein